MFCMTTNMRTQLFFSCFVYKTYEEHNYSSHVLYEYKTWEE